MRGADNMIKRRCLRDACERRSAAVWIFVNLLCAYTNTERVSALPELWHGWAYIEPGTKINKKRLAD